MTTLGDFIGSLRESKGLSQKDLAKKAGCSQATVHKIESGMTLHPGIDILVSLAHALNISVFTLVLAYQGDVSTPWKDIHVGTVKTELHKLIDQVFAQNFGN